MSDSGEPIATRSAYDGRRIRAHEHLTISSLWFSMNFLWGALLPLVLPYQMDKLVPKNPAPVLGLLTSVGAIAALIIPLFAGALSDRCASRWGRRRPYIGIGVLFILVGLGGMLYASIDLNLFLYFVSYVVLQFGANVANGAYTGVIPDLVPPDQRGLASGYMATMSGLGTAAGAILITSVIGNAYLTYGIIAGVMVVVCGWILLGLRETPLAGRPPKLQFRTYIKSLWIDPRKYPDFAWVWLTRALVMFGFYAIQPFLLYYLRDVLNEPDPQRTLRPLLAMILISTIVTGLVGGWISDRIGRKRVVYLANTLMAGVVLLFSVASSIEMVQVLGILFGLGYGAYISVDWALGTDVLPHKENAGKDMAIWHVAQALPQAIAATAAGYLISAFGVYYTTAPNGDTITRYYPSGFAAMFVMAAVFLLLGALLLRNVKGAR